MRLVDVGYGEKGMCAVAALVDAAVAVAPFAFVAVVAFPVARVGPRAADIAEDAGFKPALRVVFADEGARGCRAFSWWVSRPSVFVAPKDVRVFMGWGIAARGSQFLVVVPGGPAEAVPMLAALFGAVTGLTEVIGAVIAARAVVVKVIFNMVLVASSAGDVGFGE